MKIYKATYGFAHKTKDVTKKVIELLKINSIFKANNENFGDPAFGKVKHLTVVYERDDGSRYIKRYNEGDYVDTNIKSKHKRLGIFYTHNPKENKALIDASIKSIADAAKYSNNVDILVCSWEKFNTYGLPRIEASVKVGGIKNMYMQIAQCLNYAQSNGSYDSISFLEHDVLYPLEYFNYPEILPHEDCLYNENNIVLKKDGYYRMENISICLHQFHMKLPFAIDFMKTKLFESITKFVAPEPPNSQRYSTTVPALHINNSTHLSTTPTYYKKSLGEKIPIWGNMNEYKELITKK